MQKTTIVVPCFNEASRFQAERFIDHCAAHPSLSFIFVDDGSTDATFEMLSGAAARVPAQLSVLKLASNSGKAEAVRRGVLQAFESSTELIGYWDADLATPLDNIELFASILERPQLVLAIGSRVRLLGRNIQRHGLRHYVGRGFATIAASALGLPIYDTQCGAKLFRANDAFREVFAEPFELGWSFDVELLARLVRVLRRSGLDPRDVMEEVPLKEWVDAPGSKLRARHAPRIAWEMFKIIGMTRRP